MVYATQERASLEAYGVEAFGWLAWLWARVPSTRVLLWSWLIPNSPIIHYIISAVQTLCRLFPMTSLWFAQLSPQSTVVVVGCCEYNNFVK